MKLPVTYLGILSRADPSVAGILLGNGVRIEEGSRQQAHDILGIMEGHPVSPSWADSYLFMSGAYRIGEEPKIAFATRTWEFEAESSPEPSFPPLSGSNLQTVFNTVKIVDDGLAAMRLFKPRDIRVARSFSYTIWAQRRQMLLGTGGWGGVGPGDPFTLAPEERDLAQQLVDSLRFPLEPAYIELARECYEQAFQAHGTALPLLSISMGLEALFGSGNSRDSRRRILNGVSNLLGSVESDRAQLRKDAERIYGRRSAAIHSGQGRSVSREDLELAKDLLRRCLLQTWKLGLPKQGLDEALGL